MKKIIQPAGVTRMICCAASHAAHGDADQIRAAGDLLLLLYRLKRLVKVAIVTSGGTGHLPRQAVGEGMLDGCSVGQRVSVAFCRTRSSRYPKEVEAGGRRAVPVRQLYGRHRRIFDMAAELCEMEDIETRSIVGGG